MPHRPSSWRNTGSYRVKHVINVTNGSHFVTLQQDGNVHQVDHGKHGYNKSSRIRTVTLTLIWLQAHDRSTWRSLRPSQVRRSSEWVDCFLLQGVILTVHTDLDLDLDSSLIHDEQLTSPLPVLVQPRLPSWVPTHSGCLAAWRSG